VPGGTPSASLTQSGVLAECQAFWLGVVLEKKMAKMALGTCLNPKKKLN
jgi:hypothetical protein